MILTAKSLEAREIQQGQKIKAIEAILDKQSNTLKRHLLKKLSAAFLHLDSFIITHPTELAASLIICIFNFLEEDKQDSGFKTISLSNNSGPLLLINSQACPYLVESIVALQRSYHFSFQLLAYPVFTVKRHKKKIIALESGGGSGNRDLLLVIRLETQKQAVNNFAELQQTFSEIIHACQKIENTRSELAAKLASLKTVNSFQQQAAFIDWLQDDVFIAFTYQCYVAESSAPSKQLGMVIAKDSHNFLSKELPEILGRPTMVIVQTIAVESPVIRCERLVYIGFRESNKDGIGCEHGFIGLFDNIELNGAACKVPALCQKITAVLNDMKIARDTYERSQLREIFNLFPKIELFLLDETQLRLITHSLHRYCNGPEKIKLLILASTAPSRLSAIIIIPTPLYKEGIEQVLQEFVCSELICRLELSRKLTLGGNFIGLQMTLIAGEPQHYIDVNRLDKELNKLARPWRVSFKQILQRALGKAQSMALWQKYQSVFPIDYQTLMPPRYAIRDMLQIEQLLRTTTETINLLNPCQHIKNYRLHFYSRQQGFLDEYIQVLENLHLRIMDQVQFTLVVDGTMVFIKSFTIQATHSQCASFSLLKIRLLDIMQRILAEKTENDELNSLLILTGMAWHEIEVLRAYRNYYMQLGYQTKIASFNRALIQNPQVALHLLHYFEARFSPDSDWDDPLNREEQALFPQRLKLLQAMEEVADINEDRILRTLFNLIDATVRTNYYVRRDLDDFFISFKINSLGVIDMPSPRPQHEIYVHAVDMEGIHLRGGKISRGGIRWSDRPDDFRTEILGLMQTQMSKNALIVPTGAKGGFVVKYQRSGIEFRDSGKKAYTTLIRGLLDLTDNYVQDKVVKLPGIVSYDYHDPYLVVAADKGTAQFPDLANSVASEYQFWLADAFASGGSRGYNHKQLGITARGAWECVKRHFRERGKDIQSELFTVVGIGSMDGDVFGNGMLLSPYIQLRAAISGQHIFIDPSPKNVEQAFNERLRLFDLPGSSWDDYQPDKISQGGGVYRRDAKNIPISNELKKWLKIRYRSLDAETLIRYLLRAQVELLWFGGIGTYVKASSESSDDAGDRANDNVRVDACDIKACVVGEGANLGFTQRARIEYSLANGRINTDAIDNSAGVDISDHEVNLKIFLADLQKKKIIIDYQQLFMQISPDVCAAVLANNYAQSLCLSLDRLRSIENVAPFMQLAEHLEALGLLDHQLESFPLNKVVKSREVAALTRPELAVLMASCKVRLKQQIQEQPAFLNDAIYDHYLWAYFPSKVVESYQKELLKHPLANEIKATLISSYIINQAGCSFLNIGVDKENSVMIDALSCYLTFDRILDGLALRQAIYGLDNKISTDEQYGLLMSLENGLSELCQWAQVQQQQICPNAQTMKNLGSYFRDYENYYAQDYEQNQELTKLVTDLQYKGVPEELARRVVIISGIQDFPSLVAIASEIGLNITPILTLFETTKQFLGLTEIYQQLSKLPQHDYWERKVTNEVRENMKQSTAQLIKAMLVEQKTCTNYFDEPARKSHLVQYQQIQQQIKNTDPVNILPYVALNKALETLLVI